MKKTVSLFIMTASSFALLSAAEKPAPTLQRISESPVASTMITNRLFTKVQLIQQNYLQQKDYQKELDSLLALNPQLQQAKLLAAASFTAEIANQQKIKGSEETVKRMEQQQRDTIRHYDELTRLLTLLKKDRSTGLFGEKLKDLVDYLSESSSKWPSTRSASPARGAVPLKKQAQQSN